MEDQHPLQYQPFATLPALDTLRRELHINVPQTERGISIGLGLGIFALAFSRRLIPGLLLDVVGAALVARGISGHCALYNALGVPPVSRREVEKDSTRATAPGSDETPAAQPSDVATTS